MRRRRDELVLEEGQVWVSKLVDQTRKPVSFRRIVAILGGKVCYSDGGDRNRWCGRRQFLRVMRRDP